MNVSERVLRVILWLLALDAAIGAAVLLLGGRAVFIWLFPSAPASETSIPPATHKPASERMAVRGELSDTPITHIFGVGGLVGHRRCTRCHGRAASWAQLCHRARVLNSVKSLPRCINPFLIVEEERNTSRAARIRGP